MHFLQRRITRQRAATEANDENKVTTTSRITRAKVAALSNENAAAPLAAKQSNVKLTSQPLGRKRNALGDVSNHTRKVDGGKENQDGGLKKAIGQKTVLTTKASATNGVTKASTRAAAKAPLKSITVASEESKVVKRSSSGAGTIGLRKKSTNTLTKVKEVIKEVKHEVEKPAVAARATMAAVEIKAPSTIPDPKPTVHVSKKTRVEEPVEIFFDEDDDEDNDPLMVSEYAKEIFEYLRSLETKTAPKANYMDHQEQLLWEQRGILVDWIVEVHIKFHLLPETLYLAINIVDRFLSVKVVMLDKLQLVGITALFIAAKYEEVFSPHIGHFRYIVDDTFTEDEILRAERFILQSLDYNLSYPNPMNFLRRISKADNYDIHTRTVAKYLMEISLLDHRHLEFLPSHVAAASMYLSRMILGRGDWVI